MFCAIFNFQTRSNWIDEYTCLANDLFVNAWMPLPEPYREDEEDGK